MLSNSTATAPTGAGQPLVGDIPEVHPRLAYPNVYAVTQAWLERHSRDELPWLPVPPENVEIPFAYPLEEGRCVCGEPRSKHALEGVPGKPGKTRRGACSACDCPRFQELTFSGRIDLLAPSRSRKGDFHPVDHKTTGRMDAQWLSQWELSTQITGYLWAASRYAGREIRSAYVNGIELSLLPGSDRTCREHSLPYSECAGEHLRSEIIGPITRTDQDLALWLRETQRLARQFWLLKRRHPRVGEAWEAGVQGRWNDGCRWCEFEPWCVAGRPSELSALGFAPKPWNPLDHADPGGGRIKRSAAKFYVDNSTLKAVATCDSRALARYGWHLTSEKGEGAALRAGSAIHAALEEWFKGAKPAKALKRLPEFYPEVRG